MKRGNHYGTHTQKSAHPIGVEGPVLTIVMDGVGIGNGKEGDAVANAYTPTLDMLMKNTL